VSVGRVPSELASANGKAASITRVVADRRASCMPSMPGIAMSRMAIVNGSPAPRRIAQPRSR
jgi:hypothetical protein